MNTTNIWLTTALPLATLIIGFLLSHWGKVLDNKRGEAKAKEKQLRTLVFFLLELRYIFSKELKLERNLEGLLTQFNEKLSGRVRANAPGELISMLPYLKSLIKKSIPESEEQLDFLQNNIDKQVLQLSEFDPILAYELRGQYQIKEKLGAFKRYFDYAIEDVQMPSELIEWMTPKITESPINQLSKTILILAEQDSKTLRQKVTESLAKQNELQIDDEEFDQLMEALIKKADASNHKDVM